MKGDKGMNWIKEWKKGDKRPQPNIAITSGSYFYTNFIPIAEIKLELQLKL
jgi:hypothetical protein